MNHKYRCRCDDCKKLHKQITQHIDELVKKGYFRYSNGEDGRLKICRGPKWREFQSQLMMKSNE